MEAQPDRANDPAGVSHAGVSRRTYRRRLWSDWSSPPAGRARHSRHVETGPQSEPDGDRRRHCRLRWSSQRFLSGMAKFTADAEPGFTGLKKLTNDSSNYDETFPWR